MNKLKDILFLILKQADKLVLVAAFILLVFSLLDLMDSSTENNERLNRVSLRTSNAKYKALDRKSFSNANFFKTFKEWNKSTKRNNDKKSPDYISDYSDFMQPFKIARSIAKGAKSQLIPYKNYLLGICPITNEPLPVPNTEQLSQYTSNYDYDQDGIPDVMEKKFAMNPENPADALYDADGDSFNNITEYRQNKESLMDSASHPPLITRIVLVKISNTSIPILFKELIKYGYNKDNWKVQVNIKTPKGWKTKFLKIGDSFKVNEITYTISDIEEDYEPVLNPRLGAIEEIDKSIIILHDSLEQTIDAVMEKPVYEPNRRITLKDLYTGKNIITKVHNVISLGDKDTGIEKYKLLSIAKNNRTLTFEDESNGKKYSVGKRSSYRKPLTAGN